MLSLLKAEGEKFISQCLADREMATVDEGETAKTEGETQKKIRRETKRKRKEKNAVATKPKSCQRSSSGNCGRRDGDRVSSLIFYCSLPKRIRQCTRKK